MIEAPILPLLPKEIAKRAISDLHLLEAEAYSSAGIRAIEASRLPTEFESIDNALDSAIETGEANLQASKIGKNLQAAFWRMEFIIKARTPNSASAKNDIVSCLNELDVLRDKFEKAVADKQLPEDCLHYFDQGIKIVKCITPAQSWVDVAKSRAEDAALGGDGRIAGGKK